MKLQKPFAFIASLFVLVGCESQPQIPTPLPPSAQDYYQQGIDAENQGNYSIAENSLETAVSIQPDFGKAYCALGRVRNELKRTQPAIDAYTECVSLLPSYIEGHSELGVLYATHKRSDLGVIHLQRAVDLGAWDALVFYFLADIRRNQGQCSTPIALYKKALKVNPGFSLAKQGIQLTRTRNCKPKPQPEPEGEMDFFKRGEAQDALIRGRQ